MIVYVEQFYQLITCGAAHALHVNNNPKNSFPKRSKQFVETFLLKEMAESAYESPKKKLSPLWAATLEHLRYKGWRTIDRTKFGKSSDCISSDTDNGEEEGSHLLTV